ncbi:tail fiber domain-containing protein, partial [Klebsiella pneumoniae]
NCQRPVTGTSVDNSAYHVINNMWCTSFYGYTEKPRPDGTFYLFKNEGAGGIQIDNLVSPRADGYGIWMWGQATNSQLSNIQLYNVGVKGFEFGRSGVTSGTISVKDLYVQCRDSTVIPYTWYDWAAIDGGGLHYQGNPAVVSQYLGTNSQAFSGRTRLDLSSIGVKSIDANGAGWQRYGGLTGLDELVLRSPSNDSSVTLPFQQWTVRNPGGTGSSAGIGVANANNFGNGYARMEIRASIGGTLTSLWQLNTNGMHFSPVNDNQLDVGTAALRVKQYYGANSAILTSDANRKTEPRNINDAEISAFYEIGQLPWVWQWLLKYQSEGDGARLHSGPTVQAAIAVMTTHGLDWRKYSAFCYDSWEAQEEITTEWEDEYDGAGILVRKAGSGVTQEAREAGEVYSFRKEELLFWILRATIEKHKALEQRLTALESL